MKIKNLNLECDFDVRIIREDELDTDLFIDLKYRTVDINFLENEILKSRLQFISVRGILIRICEKNHDATIHLMRDIDLNSAFCNFEINYYQKKIEIKLINEKVDFRIL